MTDEEMIAWLRKEPRSPRQNEIADTIEALRAENARLEKAVIELTEENRLVGLQMDRFADEITRLREALKPFAALLADDDDSYIVATPSLADLRAARAAMGETE